jgi:hypothetical protein
VECIEEDVVGWVDGAKKARTLPKNASLLHFGPDYSAITTRASSRELSECATLSLSLSMHGFGNNVMLKAQRYLIFCCDKC